jgi:hypothetical protein
MIWFRKCKHPALTLEVQKDSTVDDKTYPYGSVITHHLSCGICNKKINISYFKIHGGVDAMFDDLEKAPK